MFRRWCAWRLLILWVFICTGDFPLWSAFLASEALLLSGVGAFLKFREKRFRAGSVSDGARAAHEVSGQTASQEVSGQAEPLTSCAAPPIVDASGFDNFWMKV